MELFQNLSTPELYALLLRAALEAVKGRTSKADVQFYRAKAYEYRNIYNNGGKDRVCWQFYCLFDNLAEVAEEARNIVKIEVKEQVSVIRDEPSTYFVRLSDKDGETVLVPWPFGDKAIAENVAESFFRFLEL